MAKKDLYGYFFHYNDYKKEWAAIPRGKEADYLNGSYTKEDGIIKGKCITKILLKFQKNEKSLRRMQWEWDHMD